MSSTTMFAGEVEVTLITDSEVRDYVSGLTDEQRVSWGDKINAMKLYLIRNSRNPDGPVLAFTHGEWEAFTLGVKDGEFDLPESRLPE